MKHKKKYLPMHLFNMLKEVNIFKGTCLNIKFPDNYTSNEILFEGSKMLPRKSKKKVRWLIVNKTVEAKINNG